MILMVFSPMYLVHTRSKGVCNESFGLRGSTEPRGFSE